VGDDALLPADEPPLRAGLTVLTSSKSFDEWGKVFAEGSRRRR